MIRMRNMCRSHTAYISDLLGDQLLRPLIIKKAFYAEQLEQLFVLMDAQNAFFNAEVSNWFLYTVRGTGDFAASGEMLWSRMGAYPDIPVRQ